MKHERAFGWLPNANPSWLLRRPTKGFSMSKKINDVAFTSSVSPEDWLNITFIATRLVSILGYPPISMAVEIIGTPELLWADPEEETVTAILDFNYEADRPQSSKPCLHISPTVGEGTMLALIGLCTLRNANWLLMTENEFDNSDISEEGDNTLS